MNRFPPHLIFELTAKCNYRCPFCYCVWHEFPELAKPERDTQFWKNLLDSCAENGVGDLLFTGGEAMLRPDLSELLRRDLADLIRSALMCRITREICLQTMKILGRTPEQASGEELCRLITAMGDLLEGLPEFSLNDTLDRMKRTAKLNSHAEQTLKSNAENSYCRSYIYELYRAVYEPEARCLKDYLPTLKPGDLPDREFLLGQSEKIRNRFYVEPLAKFRPKNGNPNFFRFFSKKHLIFDFSRID